MDTMSDFSPSPLRRLNEVEVFVGTIIGKTGMPNKRQRESSTGMRDQFDRSVTFIVDCITKNEEGIKDNESLARSIACLSVAMEKKDHTSDTVVLRSFKYVAAAVCLKEIERFQCWSAWYLVFKKKYSSLHLSGPIYESCTCIFGGWLCHLRLSSTFFTFAWFITQLSSDRHAYFSYSLLLRVWFTSQSIPRINTITSSPLSSVPASYLS